MNGNHSSNVLEIPVPSGAIAPAALYDDTPRPAAQAAALDRIAQQFSENVSNPGQGVSQLQNWEAARKTADEQYRILFGDRAYNEMHMRSAREALAEKQQTTPAAVTP